MDDVERRVQTVFREVFDDDQLVVAAATTAKDVPDWDSLAQIKLLISLEEEFGVQFTTQEVDAMKCIGDLMATLRNKPQGLAM